ncbi:MAG: tRNA (adenosine(37)-N6)-dimethylallyltransferase MiaA [Candidatus Omnitrophica bacterium]|nr:tRNA (adenosine(37)-N6)-dimethylallyltransferase MiaA [Candidatus Omnitrophota bacterium]
MSSADSSNDKPLVLALMGPTAVGKTALSLDLAQVLNAEIIGCDAMQIYAGLPVMTAQPALRTMAGVKHHLIGSEDPRMDFSAADYVAKARALVFEILERGRIPILVGGTGFYLKSLLTGLAQAPPADWRLREELQEMAQTQGSKALHARLQQVDPHSAERIHPNNTRRLIRALEVHKLTGRPLSEIPRSENGLEQRVNFKLFALDCPQERLARRIEAQVRKRFESGMLEEAQYLRSIGPGRSASKVLGYQESLSVLNCALEAEDAIRNLSAKTRQYAKRQRTWFRFQHKATWFELTEPANETNRIEIRDAITRCI